MKTKKQLDRLFRERFKDFEVAPPNGTWERIAAELHQKKKNRRVVPLWYKIAGVAASLLLLVAIGNYIFNSQAIDAPAVTETQIQEPDNNENRPTDLQQQQIVDKSDATKTEEAKNKLPDATEDAQVVSADSPNHSKDKNSTTSTIHKTNQAYTDNLDTEEVAQNSVSEQTDENVRSTNSTKNTESQIATQSNPVEVEKEHQQFIVPEEFRKKENSEVADVKSKEDTEEDNKKSLIEYIEEREDEKHQKTIADATPQDRWMIMPNMAPVYYNTLGSGSSIDPKFANSPKSGDFNYSYGVQVGYAVNKKLSVRAGINKVNMGYTTNNIEFAAVPIEQGLMSIDYGSASYVVTVGPPGTLPNPASDTPTLVNGEQLVPRSGNIGGSMTQNLGYYEVPLELRYNFVDTKFGFHMVGGLSTLFLDENNITVSSNGFENVIGKANNLNSISFSANLGLGVDYKLSRRFVLNVEPMFKYQINTYTNSNTDFRPYFIGVYSGLSFRF